MGFRRSFTQGLKQFAGGLAQGAAQELPNTFQRIDQRNETRHQEGRQDALTAYKAALEAGDAATMSLLEQQNPQMAPMMSSLKASAKVSAQDTAQAAEMETGGFAARYQGAQSAQEVNALQGDQLQAQQRAAMAGLRVGRFGGTPPAGSPAAAPGQPAPNLGMPALATVPGRMAPAGATVPPQPAIGGTVAPLDDAAIARQRIGQRDFTRGHLENLRSIAAEGSLVKWTDEDMNRIAREMAEANGLNPDDPQVLKATGMQVRELVNLNNEKSKERTAELVTRQLQQADARKRLSMDDLQMEQLERQKMAENPQLYPPEVLLAKGFSPVYQQFISQIPEPMRAEFVSSPDALTQYQEFKKTNGVTDTGPDRGEQTLKLMGGMTAQQKYQESMNRQVIEYQKWTRTLDKQPAPAEQNQAYEQMDALARRISGRVDPQGQGPSLEEQAAKKILGAASEDEQVALAENLFKLEPETAKALAANPAVTSQRTRDALTGKDPEENVPAFLRLGQMTKSALGGIAAAGGAGVSQVAGAGSGLTKLPEAYNNFKKGSSQPQPTPTGR